jgi:hypothetical protein
MADHPPDQTRKNHSTAARVNVTRVANGGLPAVTSAAGDQTARCVPRPLGTTCGNLFDALKWEKRMETYHTGMGIAFFDDRGWGDLVAQTLYHFPVPGAELDRLGISNYTFGGTGPLMASGRLRGTSNLGFKLLEDWLSKEPMQRVESMRKGSEDGPAMAGLIRN